MHLYKVLAVCGSLITFTAQSFGFDAGDRATQNIGACCYEDPDLGWTCIDGTTDSDCANIYAGTWYANNSCANIACPPATGNSLLPLECGEVITTHFSGLDPSDLPDPDGAVLTLVDSRIPPVGSTTWPTAGQLWSPPLFNNLGAGPDEWTAKNLGTIFGLDYATGTDPDIFVAASPGIYGDYDHGAAGVIGPAGAGGIYRIDGITGQINNFISLPNNGPGLGNIAFGSDANGADLLYATNLDDGKIYAVDSLQTIVQVFDPFGANQSADGFYANLGERPFAVAVNPQGTRLYFSVWLRDSGRTTTSWPASAGPAPTNPNNSIWSVQIDGSGLLAGAPQLEVVLPYLYGTTSNPVTDISFTASGSMLVAERVFNSDYGMFDMGHSARILEYENNLPSSRNWSLGASLNNGVAANAVGGVGSDDDSHTWATCDQIVGGGTYGITRLPYPGNTIATRITSSIPIDIPGPLKNGMGELDCMICGDPQVVGACCVTDTNGVDYCVEVTSQECATVYNGFYYGDGSDCATVTCGPPSTGACCYYDADLGWTCIDGTTDSDCTTIYAGTWYANTACSNVTNCPPTNGPGACCYEDADLGWTCTWTDLYKCDNVYFGTWYANTPCSQIDCPPTNGPGACCYEDADLGWTCTWTDLYKCDNVYFGTWYANTPCSQIDCPPISDEGACCYDDPDLGWQCGWTDQGQCENGYLGTWYANTPCSQIDCPPISDEGACCYEIDCVWDCNMVFEEDCDALNGTFYLNTPCNQIICPDDDFGACCYMTADLVHVCQDNVDYNTCLDLMGMNLGAWDPAETCDCIPCENNSGGCEPTAGSNCVGPPQYPYPDYTIFGSGTIGAQTASPSIDGGSVLMLFDLNGPPLPLPVGVNLDPYIYNHPSWAGTGNDLGSIFGLAIDEDGNIYVSTTKTWNGGDPVGIGGWGAIYKIDTNDASISVWATLPMPNNESGLGSLTYDCEHSQFFATSFEDGLIYRLDMNGNILDSFDHGSPYDQSIGGPVAFGDRPWAVEVNGNRLYYSLWNGNKNGAGSMPNEIWSIGLDATGSPIAGTEHLEITMPLYVNDWSSPVADIDFSPTGTMVLGERMQISITSLAAHEARAFEYECTAGGWVQTVNQFDVGVNGTDAAGGVDATDEYVWASGDSLEFGPDYIYGFQGMPTTGGNVFNSVLVDYQGNVTSWTADKKMLGDLVITTGIGGDTGACCYENADLGWTCIDNVSAIDCETVYYGTWYANTPCSQIDCPLLDTGACCYTIDCVWYCDMLTADACYDLLGVFYYMSSCDDATFECNEEDYGACCYENATGTMTCVWTHIEKCDFYYFGVWHPGESCECIPCDQPKPTGACCSMNESGEMLCAIMEIAPCQALPNSTFYGVGSLCENVVCCAPVGACCILGDCLLASSEQCETAEGTFYGNGIVCSEIDCYFCIGDINNDGVVNVSDLLILIAAFGTCP